jgi:hypothetical protein
MDLLGLHSPDPKIPWSECMITMVLLAWVNAPLDITNGSLSGMLMGIISILVILGFIGQFVNQKDKQQQLNNVILV